jgi:hypothetical protein
MRDFTEEGKSMFNRKLTVAAIAAAAVIIPASAALADASTPGHFTYTDALFGAVSCNEVHHPGNTLPGDLKADIDASTLPAAARVTKGGYDEVTCQLVSPSAYAVAHEGQTQLAGWYSDFGTTFDHNGGIIQDTINPAGTVYHGWAWYPNG